MDAVFLCPRLLRCKTIRAIARIVFLLSGILIPNWRADFRLRISRQRPGLFLNGQGELGVIVVDVALEP